MKRFQISRVLALISGLAVATPAVAASDPALIFAAKILTGDDQGAAKMIVGGIGQSSQNPGVAVGDELPADAFLKIVAQCKPIKVENTAPISVDYQGIPPDVWITWQCNAHGYRVRVQAFGEKVGLTRFGKVLFVPPMPPAAPPDGRPGKN